MGQLHNNIGKLVVHLLQPYGSNIVNVLLISSGEDEFKKENLAMLRV